MSDYSEYRYVIVGGGMVADSAARGIREVDPEGSIGIVAEEETPPVARPALSKKLWTDSSFSFDDAWLDTEADTGAVRHPGERAIEIDRDGQTVLTKNGVTLKYEQLLLATGGTPNELELPADDRIVYFRSINDYQRLRELSGDGRHIAVVGGSFIGSELAAALIQNDTEVALIFPDEVLFEQVFPLDLARRFQRRFEDAGVRTIAGATVDSAETEDGGPIVLTLSDESTLECDAVAIGVGVTPNLDLAEQAGLEVEDGVVVDEKLRTSDPRIFAAGDIASYPDAVLGRTRVEHVDNATEMGKQAGRNLAGADETYHHTPYFYSVIFENRYEAVGNLDSSLETMEIWNDDTGVVYYIDGDDVKGVLLWNLEGRRDDARDTIESADASDRDALRSRIPLVDGDTESDDA